MRRNVKVILFCFLPSALFCKDTIPLSVHYNPFQKAKKLIMKKENIPVIKVKIEKKVEKKPPVLTAIYNKKVFINGRLYETGEKVDGYKICKIKNSSVVFRDYRGKRVVINLIKYKKVYDRKEAK